MQLRRNDERQKEEDRDANGQRAVGLYGGLPVVEPEVIIIAPIARVGGTGIIESGIMSRAIALAP